MLLKPFAYRQVIGFQEPPGQDNGHEYHAGVGHEQMDIALRVFWNDSAMGLRQN